MEWREQALCRGLTDLFYAERGESDAEAKAICRRCPVRLECLGEGLGERHGVWAGLSERARRQVRRDLPRNQPHPCAGCGVIVPGRRKWCDPCAAGEKKRQHAEVMRRARGA